MGKQSNLFNFNKPSKIEPDYNSFNFPSTRYQGSKLKLCDWIKDETKDLMYEQIQCHSNQYPVIRSDIMCAREKLFV